MDDVAATADTAVADVNATAAEGIGKLEDVEAEVSGAADMPERTA